MGIFASDGNLGEDGMYLEVTSADIEILDHVRAILGMQHIKTGRKRTPTGTAYRIQFKRVLFHQWLVSLGMTPNKSKTLGPITVPDEYFFDFVRGVWDGDGSIYSFWDKRWRSSFMYYISFASGSPTFIRWLQTRIQELAGIEGKISAGVRSEQLKYAKREARILFELMFQKPTPPHLKRKFTKAQKVFRINERNSQKWNY